MRQIFVNGIKKNTEQIEKWKIGSKYKTERKKKRTERKREEWEKKI